MCQFAELTFYLVMRPCGDSGSDLTEALPCRSICVNERMNARASVENAVKTSGHKLDSFSNVEL